MSKHIAPVTELMLGCQIFVMNRTCVIERKNNGLLQIIWTSGNYYNNIIKHQSTLGGLKGYVSGILISSWYRPPERKEQRSFTDKKEIFIHRERGQAASGYYHLQIISAGSSVCHS